VASSSTAAPTLPPRRRPHPKLDSAKRSWYFFRRNTLAMIGLSLLIIIASVATYAATQKISWTALPMECVADYGATNPSSGYPGNYNNSGCSGFALACTYSTTPPPNAADYCGGKWYKQPYDYEPGLVPPTWTIKPFSTGPLPMGGMTPAAGQGLEGSFVYNLNDGMLRGSDWSLMFSVGIVGLGALIGMMVGAIAGYFGGMLDDVLMRLVDIFLSIPFILFVIVIVLVVSQDVHTLLGLPPAYTTLLLLVLSFAAVWWPFYARLVRGQVLVVREQKYVEAARASGASRGRILFRHIIPNSVYPILIQFSLDVGTIPLFLGTLAFLGFGKFLFPNPAFPEWGNLASIGVEPMTGIVTTCTTGVLPCDLPWWQLFFPGIALFMFSLSVNMLSDGLRDAYDPRLRR
jgi:peptide/nickel transport system permease protein